MQRKDAILVAACDNFARFGFRGASLRDIARDAGVSLTLLNHHFGDKAQLLAAVMRARQPALESRVAALRALLDGHRAISLEDLVHEWVGSGLALAAAPQGESFVRFLARVADDPAEDAVPLARERLEDAAQLFVQALEQCTPGVSRHAAASAYACANGALLKYLTCTDRRQRLADAEDPLAAVEEDRARLTRFLLAGITAALDAEDALDTATATDDAVPEARAPVGAFFDDTRLMSAR